MQSLNSIDNHLVIDLALPIPYHHKSKVIISNQPNLQELTLVGNTSNAMIPFKKLVVINTPNLTRINLVNCQHVTIAKVVLTEAGIHDELNLSKLGIVTCKITGTFIKDLKLIDNGLQVIQGATQVTCLDVSGNDSFDFSCLKHHEIAVLIAKDISCVKLGHHGLQRLIIGCSDLKQLELYGNIQNVIITDCNLDKLQLKHQRNIKGLRSFSVLNGNINHLNLSDMNELESIDLQCSVILLELYALTHLIKIAIKDAKYINISNCGTTGSTLDISNTASLTHAQVHSNSFKAINMSNNKQLASVSIQDNYTRSLDVSNCSLVILDVSSCRQLKSLIAYSNMLQQVISHKTTLTHMNVSHNQLATLHGNDDWFGSCLVDLNISHNNIRTLPLANLKHLTSLDISCNQFANLDLTASPIKYLNAAGNDKLMIQFNKTSKLDKLMVSQDQVDYMRDVKHGWYYSPFTHVSNDAVVIPSVDQKASTSNMTAISYDASLIRNEIIKKCREYKAWYNRCPQDQIAATIGIGYAVVLIGTLVIITKLSK